MTDPRCGKRKSRIAIVGGGISGLSAAYYLSPDFDVTLFESENRLGGHARTVVAGLRGDQPVDTGFIVFNYITYPLLTKLFDELDVPVTKSSMSFGVTIDEGELEYGLENLSNIFAQKRNLIRPSYYRLIADILRFINQAEFAAKDDETTISEMVRGLGLSEGFTNHYLWPVCGAIWSTPTEAIGRFPARSLVQFFKNHGLLAFSGHQWWTVKGGSREYVNRLEAALLDRGCQLRKASPIQGIERIDGGVKISTGFDEPERFDEVILACHSDQALKILGKQSTREESQALGAIRYQPNRAILHRDPSQMPKRRKAWSSWIYQSSQGAIGVTYWMNRLQNIPEDDPLFLTLNPSTPIRDECIYDEVEFAHPVFDLNALEAQRTLQKIQGLGHTWYAGAYHRHGFHEDGILSAHRVTEGIKSKYLPQHDIEGESTTAQPGYLWAAE